VLRVPTVTIPATSANLGPGFDSFGLALALHNRFSAELAEEWSVEVTGEGEGRLSSGPDNRVARSMARVFAEAGHSGLAASVRCENRIPPGAGLGSSAAAIVGGLMLGDALCGAGIDRETLLVLAAGIEGHPDNVAAALYGGFTISWSEADARGPRCVRLEPASGLAAVVVGARRRLQRTIRAACCPHGSRTPTLPSASAGPDSWLRASRWATPMLWRRVWPTASMSRTVRSPSATWRECEQL
jgi:homoserine kinase